MKDHIGQVLLGCGMLLGMASIWHLAVLGREAPQLIIGLTGGCALGLGVAVIPGASKLTNLIDTFTQIARQLPRESSLTMEVKKEESNGNSQENRSL